MITACYAINYLDKEKMIYEDKESIKKPLNENLFALFLQGRKGRRGNINYILHRKRSYPNAGWQYLPRLGLVLRLI